MAASLPRLVRRREIWWPTAWGWLLLVLLGFLPLALWARWGEVFLAQTKAVPPDILVVEGWIGPAGVKEAAAEFRRGGYRYVVATAVRSLDGTGFGEHDFAWGATAVLREVGIPRAQIITITLERSAKNRTLRALSAVRAELQRRRIVANSLTVFTVGAHARRSRGVLQSVYPDLPVGSIAWHRVDREADHWWESTERARDFLDESALYVLHWVNPPSWSDLPEAERYER